MHGPEMNKIMDSVISTSAPMPVSNVCLGNTEPWDVENASQNDPNPKDAIGRAKCRLDLIPPGAEEQMADALNHGAHHAAGGKGYGEYNWRDSKVNLTVYLGAIHRHVNAIKKGEDFDDDSGLHHAAHIAAGAMIILDALDCGMLIDDRKLVKKKDPDNK